MNVLSTKETEGSKPLKFKELSEAITMADVSVGGVDYTLFVAPCCLQAKAPEERLVLAGLVRSDKVRAGSWAIPTTLVKISVLALLIVLVGWPFLKLVCSAIANRWASLISFSSAHPASRALPSSPWSCSMSPHIGD